MPINRTRIATISEWKNNCAVAVMGDFVAEQLTNKKLRAAAVSALVKLVKDYYAIQTLTAEDLRSLFGDDYFNTPNHAQEILGCVFRDYLQKKNLADVSDQLTIDAFKPVADLLEFGVRFHIEEKADDEVYDSAILLAPDLEINPSCGLKLDVVWHNSVDIKDPNTIKKKDYHYDRIMSDEMDATLHDSFITATHSFSLTSKYIQLVRDNEDAMKEQIRSTVLAIRGERDEKKESSERRNIFHTRSTTTRAPIPLTFPSTSTAAPTAEEKPATPDATVDTPIKTRGNESWREVVINTVNREHLRIQTDQDAVAEELRQRQASLPSKSFVMYTLWKNDKAQDQVVCVDTDTQIDWDAKLAEEIQRDLNSSTPRP